MFDDMGSMGFGENEWKYLILRYLDGWTNISLTTNTGYNEDVLRFYDGFFGYLLKETELFINNQVDIEKEFVNAWKYQGKIYRIIHDYYEFETEEKKNVKLVKPKIKYHNMISHWTSDYTFKGLMYKIDDTKKYIILEADTKNHIGFDVNKFRDYMEEEKSNTYEEKEIIFPMYKECITKYEMTVQEFVKMKNGAV